MENIKLTDESLLVSKGYINGRFVDAAGGKTFKVSNPSSQRDIAQLPDMGPADTRAAIDAAYAAQAAWAARSAKDRSAILNKWYALIMDNLQDLATILTSEMGKPIAEAKGEITYGASFVQWFAEEGKRVYGDTIPSADDKQRIMVLKQPVGVVGAITPWNFPNAMITRKVAPALAVGCTVIVKPAKQTPLSALALAELAHRAGIPAGVFNVICGTDGPAIGRELCDNQKVRKITFTGSTQVGRILMRQCADHIKKVSLELGGNAPFIVFDDADLEQAVEGAMISKFRNAGQTCVCANRIYVQEGVYQEFAKRMTQAVGKLKVGDGFDEGVTTGPLIDEQGLLKVEEHIKDALAKGAQITIGGKRSNKSSNKSDSKNGTFFEPTLMTGVTAKMQLAREETFGPVAPLFSFKTTEDVIAQANDTEFGLAAYFYARDLSRVWRTAEALEYGIVGVNTGLISSEVAPFGGIKESGLGREGSKYGVDDFLELKYVCLGGI